MTKVALTIAGSDSSGAAGIQADLRTFAMQRVHGTSALACITAQNTVGLNQVNALGVKVVKAQIQAVAEDFKVDAVKTGMLFNHQIVKAVAQKVKELEFPNLVVDLVIVSRTGIQLIYDKAISSLKELLIPHVAIITPNRFETEVLSGLTISNFADFEQAAITIHRQSNAKVVLAKGGSLSGKKLGQYIWDDGAEVKILSADIFSSKHSHGNGCTLSAAVSASLVLGKGIWSRVIAAKKYVSTAVKYSLDIGNSIRLVGHFFHLLQRE